MSEYRLEFHPAAKKELDKLDHQVKIFIVKALILFIESYDEHYEMQMMKQSKIKKLQGEWSGFYRLRLRDYRMIYEKINDQLVIHIIRVAHRKEVYWSLSHFKTILIDFLTLFLQSQTLFLSPLSPRGS